MTDSLLKERLEEDWLVAAWKEGWVEILDALTDVRVISTQNEETEHHDVDHAWEEAWWMAGVWRNVQGKV